jgi:hypothetical protein
MIILPMGFLVPLRNYHAGQRLNSFLTSKSDNSRPSRADESSLDMTDTCVRVTCTETTIQEVVVSDTESQLPSEQVVVEMTDMSTTVSPIHDNDVVVVSEPLTEDEWLEDNDNRETVVS